MHAADIDGGARRYVGGYQVGLALFGHELSLLGLYQGDFGQVSEKLYTSWYTGLQAKGLLAGGDYLVECFLEEGYSPLAAASAAIQAFGGTVRYQRVFGAVTSPAVAVQYSLASGDPDRTAAKGSVGNATGADAGFQAFGQVASGSVYRPYFSNMHIASVGASFNPLEANPGRVKNSSVGLKYFYYAKYAAEGVVNSGEAALSSHDLGHGLDLSVRYSPYSDLSVFVSAGLFLPGAAFPQGEPLRFGASGGLSFSF
jgi:hypothetical protein